MAQVRWEGFDGDPVRLQAQLEHLLLQTEGRAVVLMDQAGRLLSLAGDAPQFDVTTFVSLMAADFCATQELARLMGEDQFHSVAHQGDDLSLYLTQVTPGTILALIFDRDTTLGLVRFSVRRLLPALGETIRAGMERGAADSPALGDAFGEEALGRIDRLFGSPA